MTRIVIADEIDFEPQKNTVLSISCHRIDIEELRELLDKARHRGLQIVAEVSKEETAQIATIFFGVQRVKRVDKHVVRGDETVVILKNGYAVVLNIATIIGCSRKSDRG